MFDELTHHYLKETVSKYPQKTAVTDGSTSITFGQLDAGSDRLAGFLFELGVSKGDHVAYFMRRRPECVTATLGILKSGAAYIPLDPKMPQDRLIKIIKDSNPKTIICDDSTVLEAINLRYLLEDHPYSLISMDTHNELVNSRELVLFFNGAYSSPPIYHIPAGSPDDVAYILYTSGSTGNPKGVMVTHKNIRNYIDWAVEYFNISADDRLLGTAPLYFDMSTFDIFCALSAGATLYLATENKLLFPTHLAQFIEENQINLWKGVSSLLMYMCRAGVVRSGRMDTLQTVIFAGEPLAAKYLAQWMEAFPQVSFYNGYGPTEATGVSLCYHVTQTPKQREEIPIGRPCKGAKVIVLDDDGVPVKPGEIGELCISGVCLANGYLNDPEKTSKHFTEPPPGSDMGERIYHTGDLVRLSPDGEYVFISRKDQQVKWMGYRIELGEIETNLLAFPNVNDAAVLLIEIGDAEISELIAFFESDSILSSHDLSQFLGKRLPNYMVPKSFIQVNPLPRNDRGKIDRKEILRWYIQEKA
jgi:amino acid adenylation domain-containing protein